MRRPAIGGFDPCLGVGTRTRGGEDIALGDLIATVEDGGQLGLEALAVRPAELHADLGPETFRDLPGHGRFQSARQIRRERRRFGARCGPHQVRVDVAALTSQVLDGLVEEIGVELDPLFGDESAHVLGQVGRRGKELAFVQHQDDRLVQGQCQRGLPSDPVLAVRDPLLVEGPWRDDQKEDGAVSDLVE